MAEMASMYVFAKAMSTISFLACDSCVTTHPGFGRSSAAIRTTSLFLDMVALALSLAPDNSVIGQSTTQDRQFGAFLQTQCAHETNRKRMGLSLGRLLTNNQDPARRWSI